MKSRNIFIGDRIVEVTFTVAEHIDALLNAASRSHCEAEKARAERDLYAARLTELGQTLPKREAA